MAMNAALKRALIGAGTGAIAGGVVGGVVAKKGKKSDGILIGAAMGAGVGAIGGLSIGKIKSNKAVNKAAPAANEAVNPVVTETTAATANTQSAQVKQAPPPVQKPAPSVSESAPPPVKKPLKNELDSQGWYDYTKRGKDVGGSKVLDSISEMADKEYGDYEQKVLQAMAKDTAGLKGKEKRAAQTKFFQDFKKHTDTISRNQRKVISTGKHYGHGVPITQRDLIDIQLRHRFLTDYGAKYGV